MDLIDLQKEYLKNGELANPDVNETKYEYDLAEFLIDSGIKIFPQFKLGEYLFDMRLKDYPILIEVDGYIHITDKKQMARDYKKMRLAILDGYTVLKYTNEEIKSTNLEDILKEIQCIINNREKRKMSFMESIRNLRIWRKKK